MTKPERSLEDLLQSLSEYFFPEDEEPGRVTLKSTSREGETPLHIYLWRGDNSAAQILIAQGADVNAIGDMGETPLHVAARTADVETLVMLLIAQARTDIASAFGQTPAQVADDTGRSEIFQTAKKQARQTSKDRFTKKRVV